MTVYKNIVFLSILALFFTSSCNNKAKTNTSENKNRVSRVESSMMDSVKQPYIQLLYNDEGELEKSITTAYKTLSNGKTKLLSSSICNYTRDGNKIRILGIREKIDSISDESTTKEINIELEIDGNKRIVKRIDYNSDLNEAPLVDIFEWDNDKIIKKKRSLDGVAQNGSYESTIEYRYKDGNMTEGISNFVIETNSLRTNSRDTIKCEYNTNLPNHYTIQFPDEYELSYDDISFFPVRCSKNQVVFVSYAIAFTQGLISENKPNLEINGIYTVSSSFTLDKDQRIITRKDIAKSNQEKKRVPTSSQNDEETNQYEINFYYTY